MKVLHIKQRFISLIEKRELQIIFFGFVTIFLFLALYSYHPHDPSWFFYSTQTVGVQNWCGKAGAQLAALCFYLFGSISFLLVLLSAAIGYAVIMKRSWHNEWERFIAFGVLMSMSAAFFTLHKIVFYPHTIAGGYVGYRVMVLLYSYLDFIGAALGVYTFLLASFIVVTRLSFMPIVHYGFLGIRYSYVFMVRHQVIKKMCRVTKIAVWYASRPWVYLFNFGKTILDGSAFEQTGLLVPEDEYLLVQSKNEYHDQVDDTHKPIEETQHELQDVSSMLVTPTKQAGHKTFVEPRDPIPSFTSKKQKNYSLPHLDMFVGVSDEKHDVQIQNEMKKQANILEEKLERFGVSGSVVSIKRGPVVTLFEYQPAIDTKLSRILSLEDDLALALQAMSIRILAPIPGRSVVGFEVSNKNRKDVLFSTCIKSKNYKNFSGALPLVLGEDTIGSEVIVDLARMPHLLIAGSTGSGKSVALNAMLVSLLCKRSPSEMRMILIDPKRLEFAPYADIAHLLFPIITDPQKASPVLRWVVKQMEERYEKMAACGARNIQDYNEQVAAISDGEKVPYIIVVIDELSDLMLTAGKEIEDLITRIAQMARAAGIHLILATQRPSVDVITGLIKVNFPSRISFRVTSKVDSRTILDCVGSEKLLGRGDMLFLNSTAATLKRVHGAYVSDKEIEQVVNHIRQEQQVQYHELIEEPTGPKDLRDADDALYQEILSFLDEIDDISISLLQRRFRIGYNRSARIIEILEAQGRIMPADGSKTRKVIH